MIGSYQVYRQRIGVELADVRQFLKAAGRVDEP